MHTQKTLDKQTATFIAALAQNVPALSGGWMQFLIGNPNELKKRLAQLQPTLRGFIEQTKICHIELIGLDPQWDFLIMRSSLYPEAGIAVSNRNGSLGKGFRLTLPWEKEHEQFSAPCGCCSWFGSRTSENANDQEDLAIRSVREACSVNGIKVLLFHCWHNAMKQDVDGLKLLDPYGDQLGQLDKERFLKAFNWAKHMDGQGNVLSLATLFEKQQ